ncbi:MAG TPA: hypothetical protein VHU19_03600 [Pyrinomonadaceae bacterium]|jgi:hypothetical protein|nr:hypothetical protein [Pyrinomonadaceae bacterium]
MSVLQFPDEAVTSPPPSKHYKLIVAEQLQKFERLGLLVVRDGKAEQLIAAWAGALWDASVPINLLPRCFQRAVELHRSSRDVNASEVIQASRVLCSETSPVRSAMVCEACGGTRFVPADPIVQGGISYSCVKPCEHCRAA